MKTVPFYKVAAQEAAAQQVMRANALEKGVVLNIEGIGRVRVVDVFREGCDETVLTEPFQEGGAP